MVGKRKNAANGGGPGRGSTLRKIWDTNKYPLLFLSPWLIGFIGLSIYPIVSSFYLSFTNFNMFEVPSFIGLSNYKMLIESPRFLQSCKVTLTYVAFGVPLQLIFALLLAVVLNKGIPGLKYFRAIYYLPALLGGSAAVALMWRQVFEAGGIFNQFLGFIGMPESVTRISWITNPNYSLFTLVLLRVWQFGSPMIIFLAGLKQIPQELYESAAIDGANPFQQFRRITLPLLSPIILFNLIMQTVSAFQSFTPAFIIDGMRGGALDSLLMYTLYLYLTGFTYFKMGLAAAMAWLMVIAISVFTFLIFKLSDGLVFYSE